MSLLPFVVLLIFVWILILSIFEKNKKGIIISSVMIAIILLVAGFLIIEMALFLNNFK
jgi:hypothetical protein